MKAALVRLRCYNKIPQTGWVANKQQKFVARGSEIQDQGVSMRMFW